MIHQVKVYNRNTLPFKQKFKGEMIEIPAGGFVEMEFNEAIEFKSEPFSMEFDGMNQQKPSSYKMIALDQDDLAKARAGQHAQVTAYKCHFDGSLHATKEDLAKHEYELAHKGAAFADPEGAKIAKQKRA